MKAYYLTGKELVCTNCGWSESFNKFWALNSGINNLSCLACKKVDSWKQRKDCSNKELENTLWRRLIAIEFKEWFYPGTFMLRKEFKLVDGMVESDDIRSSPKLYRDLKRLSTGLSGEFVDNQMSSTMRCD